jgi:putative ABC transport system permease protein
MNLLGRRLILRALWKERGRALAAILSVALGVAVFLSIRLANRAAVASFEGFANGVGQGSDAVVRAEAGPLDETLLPRLDSLRDSAWIRPIIEGGFSKVKPFESFQIVGTDLVGIGNSLSLEAPGKAEAAPDPTLQTRFFESIQDPRAVMISAAFAKSEHLLPDMMLRGFVNDRPVELRVAGILADAPNRPALQRNLLVMDLPAAQEVLQRPGQLDRLELGLREGGSPRQLEADLLAMLPQGWVMEAPEQRASSGKTMTAAFRFNLTVLSLIALAVGAYLLFQAFDATVNRRRETWATLQALGCEPAQIMRFVLAEAALLGGIGSLAGGFLGWLLAQASVRGVSQTVAALYGASSATHANLKLREALLAGGMGFLVCLMAAWIPASRASRTPPVQLLARGSETKPTRWAFFTITGLVMTMGGAGLAFLPTLPPGVAWHAYVASVLVLLGGSLASVGLMPLLGAPGTAASGWNVRLALRPLRRPTGRHGFAAAALAVAVGMATGMGVMVSSFERTVQTWISGNLRADLYLAPLGSAGAASQHRLAGTVVDELARDPAVLAADRFQLMPLQLRGQQTFLGAGDFSVLAAHGNVAILSGGPPSAVLLKMRSDGTADAGALASETFSRRFGIHVGESLDIPTADGSRRLTVRGIYADYGNERGSLIVDRLVFQAWFHDDRCASVALYLKPGQDRSLVARRLAETHPGLQVRSNADLRKQVSITFRQTFAITYALEIIGLAVAIAGLVQALVGLALARRGEIWTLRALGASRSEITGVLLGEGLGVALAGTIGGMGIGLILAQILVRVLNPQVFGWTLRFSLPWGFLALLLGLSLAAAAAALLPAAHWAARLDADREAEEGA